MKETKATLIKPKKKNENKNKKESMKILGPILMLVLGIIPHFDSSS